MDGLVAAWDTAEAERIRLEAEAADTEFNADYAAAKAVFDAEKAYYDELEGEVRMWREMRDAEEDL